MKQLRKIIKPGDVILIDGKTKWYNLPVKIAYMGIRLAQYFLFGKEMRWQDTHVEVYFSNKKILSVETPKAIYDTLEGLKGKKLSVWRYTKKELTKKDINVMKKAANKLIGTKYDYGQLLNIAFNQILGYPYKEKSYIFDFGSKFKVCSVGAGVCYRAMTKSCGKSKLFSRLNKLYWDKKFIKKFNKTGYWGVENYYPDHFANSEMFDNEFRCVYMT